MRTFFLLNLAILLLSSSAQIVSKQKWMKSLPGFLPLEGEYLFIDETEITNLDYLEYLSWLKERGDVEGYNRMHPDTTVWRSKTASNEPYVNYYFKHPAYHHFPVVGVQYFQAQAYCKWRAERIMEILKLKDSPIEKIEIRLPSEEEWKKAARGTLPEGSVFPWEENGLRKEGKKGRCTEQYLANLRSSHDVPSKTSFGGMITAEVRSYWPNTIGLYNMAGNVSEWVEGHKAMGSNWNGYAEQAKLNYSPPVLHDTARFSTVGFRCVLEIVSFKRELQSEPLELSVKSIEKGMMYLPSDKNYNPIKEKQYLFASSGEVTNRLFNTFLHETKQSDFKSKSENWYKYARYHHMQMYDWHPYYDDFPVVNISYEAAIAYCKWLTEKYNSLEKRTYKKVVFKLPTEKEWEFAAYGGRLGSYYPWGGPYTRNSKGCYLANFCPLEEQYISGKSEDQDKDGGLMYNYPNGDYTISRTVDRVEFLCNSLSYFPNDFGIYQTSGNAAEMISEKGVSKGGSWNSSQYQVRISSKETYSGSDATLGFRVFMKVLEHW